MGRFVSGGAAVVALLVVGVPTDSRARRRRGGWGNPGAACHLGDRRQAGALDGKHLACTPADVPANFRVYSLGSSFDGLPLTAVLRQCEDPGLDASIGVDARGNSTSYIYGDCELPMGEGGCAPPLEVQVRPACERSVSDYDMELPPRLTDLLPPPNSKSLSGELECTS